MMKPFTSLFAMAVAALTASAQQCYSMDGQALDSRYQPCYPQASSSACCMLNGTQGANQQNDLCMDSGLCQSTSGWYAGFLYINGCTDKTGKADGCSKVCSFMGNQYSWSVLQCEPGKFCCRAASDKTNCCNNNSSMISTSHIGNLLLPGSASAINTTFNFTESPAVTNSNSPNSTCSASASISSCPADHSVAVSGAVGGVLGAALIGALIALGFALRSRKHYKVDLDNTNSTLTALDVQAAAEKADLQKQLDEQQRHAQSMPPNYPNMHGGYVAPVMHGYNANSGAYSPGLQTQQTYHTPAQEIDGTHSFSELSGGEESRIGKGNVVEVASERDEQK